MTLIERYLEALHAFTKLKEDDSANKYEAAERRVTDTWDALTASEQEQAAERRSALAEVST